MRRRFPAGTIQFVLACSWLAAQLLGPLSVISLAAGDHSVRPGDTATTLILGHEHGRDAFHHHGGDASGHHHADGASSHPHGAGAFGMSLLGHGSSAPEHEDHVVRLPRTDRAKRPDVERRLPLVATGVVEVTLVTPGAARFQFAAPTPCLGPPGARRNMPLLL